MIYLDTSAMAKLITREAETAALLAWLTQRSEEAVVTSALGRIELMRTAARDGTPGMAERAHNLLDSLDIVPISESVVALAETIGAAHLRSLDAIHLASAAQLGNQLGAFVAYDHRLLDGCRALGYVTASPGN
ncbi:type II toxin-antitoxin system VapC family toxin [Rhodococcus sp. NPDC058521]|uniref:type II toxin-antitoxin system VapC family toxin n=1 Tax=Rhodococcus sp. NPDC058521 TaxID=3346536 RepID=UPI003653697A